MNKGEFQLLKQYFGSTLLNYTLNTEQIAQNISFDDVNFNNVQINILDDIYYRLKALRIKHIKQNGFGDFLSIFLSIRTDDNFLPFNEYRKKCNGDFPEYKTDDNILNFLLKICFREYPYLLIKSSISGVNRTTFSIESSRESIEFCELVKSDYLDKYCNNEDGLDYALLLSTEDEINLKIQVCMLPQTIICRSFQNACNKMDYSLNGVIREITKNLKILRDLVEGKEIKYSSFIGFKGLILDNKKKLILNGACLHQLDDISNPSILTNSIVGHHTSKETDYYSGCILEITHKTKLSNKSNFMDNKFYSSMGIVSSKYQNSLQEKFELAVVFTLDANRAMQATSFENGFPLNSTGNLGFNLDKPYDTTTIKDSDVQELKDWFNKLNNTNTENIRIPLNRLRLAIFERFSIEDSILDALIAWEGIFSGRSETTFQIASSISKYIDIENYTKEKLFARIKKLYGLRSAIVHGATPKIPIDNETRSEVIKIGLSCIKKILDNQQLISLSPEERVKQVVVFN